MQSGKVNNAFTTRLYTNLLLGFGNGAGYLSPRIITHAQRLHVRPVSHKSQWDVVRRPVWKIYRERNFDRARCVNS